MPTWRSSPRIGHRVDIIGGRDGMAIVNAIVEVVARHGDLWSVFRVSSSVAAQPLVRGPACNHERARWQKRCRRPVMRARCRSSRRLVRRLHDIICFGHRYAKQSPSPPATIPRRNQRCRPASLVVSEETTDRLLRDALALAETTGERSTQ